MPGGYRRLGAGFGVATIGAVLLGASSVHVLFYHLPAMRGQEDPTLFAFEVAELVFLLLPPVALVYAAFRIPTGVDDEATSRQLTIVAWCALGAVVIPAVIGAIKLHQFLGGAEVAVTTAQLELLTGAGAGGVLDLLVGLKNARARRQTARVREQRDAFVFLNRALRHHVLNSLNVVIGYAEKGRDRLPEDERPVLDPAIRRSRSVVELVEDVDRIAETYTGEHPGRAVDIVSTVSEEVETARTAYPYARFECSYPDDAVYVHGNGSLHVAVENVVTNAVEHNDRQDPTVRVSIRSDSDAVSVRIADDGPGVSTSEREQLDEPPDTGAAGFGLYLANEIVEYHRGTVEIEDRKPRGTVVELTFPRASVEQ